MISRVEHITIRRKRNLSFLRKRSARAARAALAAALLLFGCSKSPERLTIAFSNDTMGKIRSCGCSKNDFGGLGRRATFLREARDTTQNLLILDAGDFFGTQINYGKEKADLTMKSMAIMKYDAVTPGEADFSLGLEYLRERIRDIGLPVVCANVYETQTGKPLFPSHKIVTYPGGLRIGVVGLFGEKIALPPQIGANEIEVRSALSRARAVIRTLRPDVDLIVVLAHMGFNEVHELAMNQDGIDIIIFGHEGRPMRATRRINGAYLLQVPKEGKYLGIANVSLDAGKMIAQLAVKQQPMSNAFADDEAVIKLFEAYDIDIALKEKATMPTGVTNPDQIVRKPFVTAEKCKECHKTIFDGWAITSHAAAFDTLVAVSKDFNRDCTPCHSTGFYEVGGFVNAGKTPDLVHVQCEACHGNGFDHSKDPSKKTGKDARASCADCHTEEWSPSFDFAASWQKIAH